MHTHTHVGSPPHGALPGTAKGNINWHPSGIVGGSTNLPINCHVCCRTADGSYRFMPLPPPVRPLRENTFGIFINRSSTIHATKTVSSQGELRSARATNISPKIVAPTFFKTCVFLNMLMRIRHLFSLTHLEHWLRCALNKNAKQTFYIISTSTSGHEALKACSGGVEVEAPKPVPAPPGESLSMHRLVTISSLS